MMSAMRCGASRSITSLGPFFHLGYRSRQIVVRAIAVCFLAFGLTACDKLQLAADTEWKSGAFRLVAVGSRPEMSLIDEHSSILVGRTIFAVGADERHIVLKQHPESGVAGTSFDRSVTRYFVVGRDKTVKGPLSKEEFDAFSGSLGLPPFTKVFEELQ